MKRVLLWMTPTIVLVTAGLIAILLLSQTGLGWVFRIAQSLAPGQLTADAVHGRLTGPITLQGLRYRDDGMDLQLGSLTLAWQPGQLLSGRVVIRELLLTELDARLPPKPADEDPQPAAAEALPHFSFDMPLPVQLERFELRSATIHPADGEALDIDLFTFSATARESWVTFSAFRLESAMLNLAAEGLIPLSSTGTLRVDLRFRSDIDDLAVAGQATLRGTADDVDTRLMLSAPVNALGEARLRAFEDPLRWDVSAGVTEPFALTDLLPDSRPLHITAVEIEARGTGNDIRGSGHLALHDVEFGRWGADVSGRWDGELWRVDDLLLSALEGDTRVRGQATQVGDDGFDVALEWEHLVWPLSGQPLAGSPQGTATVRGTPDAWDIRLDGEMIATDVPDSRLSMQARGDSEALVIERLDVDWLNGHWHLDGRAAWLPHPAWDLSVTASDIEPGLLHPEADGQLQLSARVAGEFDDLLTLDIDLADLSGHLRGHPVAASGRLGLRDDVIEVHDLAVDALGATLQAQASIDGQWQAAWRLTADDLSLLEPTLSGRLRLDGTVSGPVDALRARIDLEAGGLAWQEHAIDSLGIEGDIGLFPAGQWQVSTHADGIVTAGEAIGDLRIDSRGTIEDHTVAIRLDHDNHHFEQQLSGAVSEDLQWAGRLHDGKLEQTNIGEWRQDSTPLQLSATSLALGDWCWRQQTAAICVSGTRDHDEMQARLDWNDLNLARLNPLLEDLQLSIAGDTHGEATVAWHGDRPGPLRLTIRSDPGMVGFPLPQDRELHLLSFEDISVNVTADEADGLVGDLRVTLNEDERLGARFRLPQWRLDTPVPDPGHDLDAGIEVELHDLSLIAFLVPELQTGPGTIEAAIEVTGTVGQPHIDGGAHIGFDHVEFSRLGIRTDDMVLDLAIVDNDWTVDGRTRMDQGLLAITGSGEVHNPRDWHGQLALTGEHLQTLRMPGIDITTSPAITLEVSPDELIFGGSLVIPRARLEPVITESATPVSDDVIIIGDDISDDETIGRFITHGRIEIILGDQVRIAAMGLEGRLAGQLMVIVERDGGLNGLGEIRIVDGRFRAYGQNLTITQGRILYAGGTIDNPAIDVTASRMRGDIEVGVRVTGTADQPQVELFSNPTMDEGDILSYLVLGRPLDQAGEGDGQLLHQAAASLALAGGEALTERISERYGIDEVAIESGDDIADTALVLGRAISPRIYIRYIQGLVENTNAFQVRYRISNKWTLETESGTRSGAGADILFSLER